MKSASLQIFDDPDALSRSAAGYVARLAEQAVSQRGRFLVALAGGSTPRRLYRLLTGHPFLERIPWQVTHWFWGDERCVPPDDPESNYGQARALLFDHVPAPETNIHRVRGELDPPQAAADYAHTLRRFADPGLPWPRFDLVLLGLGADGHTASLFPGSPPDPGPDTATLAVTATYAGRPAHRVTLTPRVFNDAHHVLFLVSRAEKAAALATTLDGPRDPLRRPAQRIHPSHGQVTYLVDRSAARFFS
ncbi:MAG: 6-phosphogluconolactonase [Anaerolineales bacterium]